MTAFQWVSLAAGLVLMAVLVAGLLTRGAWRVCPSFAVYAAAVLLTNVGVALRPQNYDWNVYLSGEVLHAALRLVLAGEIGWRMFAHLPGARASLAAGLLLVVTLTLAAVLLAPLGAQPHVVAQTALARLLHGTAWIFGALLAAKLYYRIPVHPLHQAILRGFVPFLLTFTVALGLFETFGWDVRLPASYAYTTTYMVMLVYWNRVAWRRSEPPDAPAEVVRRLQPWRKM
jgi:hypothetical protein